MTIIRADCVAKDVGVLPCHLPARVAVVAILTRILDGKLWNKPEFLAKKAVT